MKSVQLEGDSAAHIGQRLAPSMPVNDGVASNTTTIYPFQALLAAATTGFAVDSKAQAERIRSVATERLRRRIGRLPSAELARLDEALRLHLDL